MPAEPTDLVAWAAVLVVEWEQWEEDFQDLVVVLDLLNLTAKKEDEKVH